MFVGGFRNATYKLTKRAKTAMIVLNTAIAPGFRARVLIQEGTLCCIGVSKEADWGVE